MAYFGLFGNRFTGYLPEDALMGMEAVTEFYVSKNYFTGTLPQQGIRALTRVSGFSLYDNGFTGMLLDSGIEVMRAVTVFRLYENSFSGMFPERSICAMTAMAELSIYDNGFRGTLPHSIARMMAVTVLRVYMNGFTGMLPEQGIRSMLAVAVFGVSDNPFRGTLPSGIRTMTAVVVLVADFANFEGTLPQSFFGTTALRFGGFSHNRFAGTLPASLGIAALDVFQNYLEGTIPPWTSVSLLCVSHNYLAGSIPEQLLSSHDPMRKVVVANDLLLEGTIPERASRMTMTEIIMSIGHGLKGSLPRILGTLTLLSLSENMLQGHLPPLHIAESSVLFVYANDFSCKLPQNGEVKLESGASLALIGNQFTQSQHLPAWINEAEKPSDMFCVSNQQALRFLFFLACGACFFIVAAFMSVGGLRAGFQSQIVNPKLAHTKAAWSETGQHMIVFCVVCCALLAFYNGMVTLACGVASDRLRFHFGITGQPAYLVVCTHMWLCRTSACFHRRQGGRRWHSRSLRQNTRRGRCCALPGSMVNLLWFLLCCATAAPQILYSAVKAVPGFMGMPALWRSAASNAVGLFSGLVTSFGLPPLASFLWEVSGREVDKATLQVIGLLLASMLLPALVTLLFHAECLGAWTWYWDPCVESDSFIDDFSEYETEVGIHIETGSALVNNDFPLYFYADTLSNMCNMRWQMDKLACIESVTERLAWLLHPKFVHYTFTLAAARMLRARFMTKRMTLRAAKVLLSYTWLAVTLFGPCLPTLIIIIALLVQIYTFLLFDADLGPTDAEWSQERSVSVQNFGLSSVAVLALLLQFGNLLCR